MGDLNVRPRKIEDVSVFSHPSDLFGLLEFSALCVCVRERETVDSGSDLGLRHLSSFVLFFS